jgi:hypothetical protein
MRRVGLIAMACLALLPSCGGTEERRTADGPTLQRYGIKLEVPAGWDVAIMHGAVRAANFPLSSSARDRLSDGRLLLELFENDTRADSPPPELADFPKLARVPTLASDDFQPPDWGNERIAGLARRTFSVSGRLFVLFAESGTKVPPADTLAQLDELLASMSIAPGTFYSGRVDPPRFPRRAGWHVGDSGTQSVLADGNFLSAWASTIPYRDTWDAAHANETLEALPGDGIVIWIGITRTNRFAPRGPAVTPPLRIADFERRAAWEGQVRDLPEYLLWARVDDEYELDARVFFGRPEPTAAMVHEADAMLAGLRLPDWPPWE